MGETDANVKPARKNKGLRAFWPDVSTLEGAKEACRTGGFAAGWLAGSYVIMTVYTLSTGQVLFGDAPQDETEKLIIVVFFAVFAIIAAILAVALWRRQSIIAGVISFLWVGVESAAKLLTAPGSGTVISIILFLAALAGLRGAIAARRLPRDVDVEQFS